MECAFSSININYCERGLYYMSDAPTELALINSLIVVLIIVDAIVRIVAAKSNSFDPG